MKADRRKEIIEILAKYYLTPIKSMKDIHAMDTWCENTADEILALPIDVPIDEEIKAEIDKRFPHNETDIHDCVKGLGFFKGAKWAISEIERRNSK